MATAQQIIGKINPLLYAENGKELLRKYRNIDNIPAEEVEPKNFGEHSLGYDSSSETLEPIYFYVLDLMNDFDFEIEKLVDNFSSTPGSGHFAELGQRATIMQQQGAKILGDVNMVLRSVLNIIYDLKEFRIRLQSYDDLNSKEKEKSEAALLSLKQIWMDKVDIQKGQSSIKAMALGQAGFQTLIHAFLVAKDEKDVDKIDLNYVVKRILKARVHEFNIWVKQSEKELSKRYELEKNYLRSQVNSLKLYSRWVKPYLKHAHELEAKEMKREPALVKTFNTILLELTLLGKSKIDVKKAALEGLLPEDFQKLKSKRDYFTCVLVEFKFRGIPQKISQQQSHYVFGGKAEIKFMAYALNSDELEKFDQEIDKSDVEDVLGLIEGATTESLGELQEDIDFFLEENNETKKDANQKAGSNPFLALVGYYNESPGSSKENKTKKTNIKKIIKQESWIEKTHIRKLAEEKAKESAFNLFDVYKKAHGMPSYT
ncbi:MAG: hypothetical protein IIA85_02190 [Nanoarchaeota archaeon]|nr:hypothetical protein [Nanoarchaeota archaeon]